MKAARVSLFVIAVAILALGATAARADWDPGDLHKMHYPQLPDLQTGVNVRACPDPGTVNYTEVMLADDWQCSQTGDVTDIHIWGSWRNDIPMAVPIHLSIWSDLPAGGVNYSQPNALLWDEWFQVGDYSARLYHTVDYDEPFFDPQVHDYTGSDTQIWQYNFTLGPGQIHPAFHQDKETIYWLAVEIHGRNRPDDLGDYFGWKTTDADSHFQDYAVWTDHSGSWFQITDTSGHNMNWDMAFVITPEPATLALVGLGAAGLVASRRRRR